MANKNITLIGVNFYPEDSAIGLYSTQMAYHLCSKGYDVTVVTGFPYYPQWQIRDEYTDKNYFLKEEIDGLKVYRYRQFVPKDPTFLKRLIHLIDFTLGSLINIFRIRKADVVIAVVPFTSAIFLGWVLKKRTKARLWVHVQDFEFDAALQTGITKNKPRGFKKVAFDLLFVVEKYLFSKADIASTISYSMLDKLKSKTNEEIIYLPNWIDADIINPTLNKPHHFMLSHKYKILYSGNIGDKQDWRTFISFVAHLKEDEYEIIVVGDGAKRDWLLNQIKTFKNIKYYPPVPFEDLSSLLCNADLHILFQKMDVIDTVMPSKLLGMMASAKPSLVMGNANSEVKKILTESNGGMYYSESNIEALITFVKMLRTNKELSVSMGKSARSYIIDKFSKETILGGLSQRLEKG